MAIYFERASSSCGWLHSFMVLAWQLHGALLCVRLEFSAAWFWQCIVGGALASFRVCGIFWKGLGVVVVGTSLLWYWRQLLGRSFTSHGWNCDAVVHIGRHVEMVLANRWLERLSCS